MSHPRETRLKLLELAKPANEMPDIVRWIERTKQLEAYVFGDGQADEAPSKPTLSLPPSPDNRPSRPGHRK